MGKTTPTTKFLVSVNFVFGLLQVVLLCFIRKFFIETYPVDAITKAQLFSKLFDDHIRIRHCSNKSTARMKHSRYIRLARLSRPGKMQAKLTTDDIEGGFIG